MFTNYGKSGLTLLFAGSANVPRYLAIGSGSGANVVTLGSLIAEVGPTTRTDFTSRDISQNQKTIFTYDLNSVQMSGINLREFGIGGSAAKTTNDLWSREGFTAITFNGENELQIEVTFQSY